MVARNTMREYRIWKLMRQRCSNPNNPNFDRYGGRGIRVCDRWQDFASFMADMGSAPSDRHTLDRIDGNKGYEPGNCRWATRKEQSHNTSTNKMVTIGGVTKCVSAWAEEFGIKQATFAKRIRKGWNPEDAARTKILTRSEAQSAYVADPSGRSRFISTRRVSQN